MYKFLNTLKYLLNKYKPIKLIVVFDNKKNTFRNKIFKEYKINRKEIPTILINQIPLIHSVLKNIGIPIISIPYFEADDVIGTLAKIEEKKGNYVLIGTCDKDFSQLVNENIHVLSTIKNKILNSDNIIKEYGIHPKLIIDFISLVGDKTDNIPGVFGIGKVTAINLLKNIGGIKHIYKNIKLINHLSIRGKKNIIKRILDGKKMAFLSYRLAKIKINININNNYLLNKYYIFHPCCIDNNKYIDIIYQIKNIIIKNTKMIINK